MKRVVVSFVVFVLVITLFAGCGWVGTEMVSIEPFQFDNSEDTKTVIEVLNYNQMQEAVVAFVESGVQSGILSAPNHNSATVHVYMDNAIRNAIHNTPIGSYAVEKITYEVGVRSGVNAIALRIYYHKDLSELMRIKNLNTVNESLPYIQDALATFEDNLVFRVKSYESTDIVAYIEKFAFENPNVVVSMPDVSVSEYPNEGDNRIIEIEFTYKHDKDTLLHMQNAVTPVFTAAQLYVIGATRDWDKYSQLYSFLMERDEYIIQSTNTPAYSILNDAVGDSADFAQIYFAMCKNAGLSCDVITGLRNGEAWSWNAITVYGEVYYIDLLACLEKGEFASLTENELTDYEWIESR